MKIDRFLEESPAFAITRAARLLDASLTRALANESLNFLQGLVLVSIFFEGVAKVSPSQLASTFSTTRGNISHCLSALEGRGLVKRQIDPDDARVLRISIRPDGKKCAMRLIAYFNSLQNSLEKEIGRSELRAMLATIARVEQLCG